ncbi:MAG: hypothetical protein AAFP04_06285 [Myxococcota bacterium]
MNRAYLTVIAVSLGGLMMACGDEVPLASDEASETEVIDSDAELSTNSGTCPGICNPGDLVEICLQAGCGGCCEPDFRICNECCNISPSCDPTPPPPPPPACPGECVPGQIQEICLQAGCGGCCEPDFRFCNDSCEWVP